MCGIVGFISDEDRGWKKRSDFFQQALFVDTLRGWNSTGIFNINQKDQLHWIKKAVLASDFLDMGAVQKVMNGDNKIMVGHNRAATVGALTTSNAHPFECGNITGVHNGTLEWSWRRNLPDADLFDVDSQALLNSINQIGYKETLKVVEGAFTLVWYDEVGKLLRITRNKERPLWIGHVKGEDTTLFASEMGMLKWIANRNGYEFTDIFQPDPGKLLTFSIGEKVNIPHIEDVELYKPKYNHYYDHRDHKGSNDNVIPLKGPTTVPQNLQDIDMDPAENQKFYLHEFKPYSNKLPEQGYAIGYSIHNFFDDGEPVSCIVHGIELPTFLDNLAVENVDELVIIGKPAGLSHQYNDSEHPHVLINVSKAAFYNLYSPEIWTDVNGDSVAEDESVHKEKGTLWGPGGSQVTLIEFERLTKDGCCMCGSPIDPKDHKEVTWTFSESPVCPHEKCKETAAYCTENV